MRIIKLAALLLIIFYSSFSFSHTYTQYQTPEACAAQEFHARLGHYCVYANAFGTFYDLGSGPYPDGNVSSEPEADCPSAGPVSGTHLSTSGGILDEGSNVIIDGCEYQASPVGVGIITGEGSGYSGYNLTSTGRSSDDITAAGETLPIEATAPSDYTPESVDSEQANIIPSVDLTTGSSSSSSTNEFGDNVVTDTTTTVNQDGDTITKTTTTNETVTNSSTGSTSTITTVTQNVSNTSTGTGTTTTTVTNTDGNGNSQVIGSSTESDYEIDEPEEEGTVTGGLSCSSPPSRSGDVSDAEFNNLLQNYYTRCTETDLIDQNSQGFGDEYQSILDASEQELTDLFNTIESEFNNQFSIDLSTNNSISENIHTIKGASIDFSLSKFSSFFSYLGYIIIFMAYFIAFSIIMER